MKSLSNYFVFIALLSIASTCQAQQTVAIPPATPYTIVSRDANSRIWQNTTYEVSPSGQTIPHIHQYTELASGLCYRQNGHWVDSQEQINILPDGTGAATNGQHQAYFPAEIYNGAIVLVTGDGLQMQSRPIGLSYSDGTNTVLIAELTNSVGQLISSNQVIYTNAFVGVSADLLYTYRKSGFEQDVIFRARPPTPEQCGLCSTNSRLQLLTEFFNAPTPIETAGAFNAQDGLEDTNLTFGTMKMARGRAFLMGTNSLRNKVHQIPVYKSWVVVDGRTLLIEEVPYWRISPQLATLPSPVGGGVSSANYQFHKFSSKRSLPPARLVENTTNAVHLAKADFAHSPGLVFDYLTIDADQNNFTFQEDMTYYVSGEYDLVGITVFEGGTVIKLSNVGQIDIDETGSIDCETASYLPAVFTSMNDNSVGETIDGSTGSPKYMDVYECLWIPANVASLQDLRFNYAYAAITQGDMGDGPFLSLSDCQFLNGDIAVSGYDFGLYNVLIGRTTNLDSAIIFAGDYMEAQNITADSGTAFIEPDYYFNTGSYPTIDLANCIISQQSLLNNDYATLNTNATAWLPSPSGPIYQTVGGGNYYLTNNSPYRGIGTNAVEEFVLQDLAQKTTYPPVVYSNTTISVPTTLSPQAQRDNSQTPDLGYHYDPLDYIFGGCDLYSSLTVSAGTAIGWYEQNGGVNLSGQPYGISLNHGANLSFNGNVTKPCYFSRFAMVQEGGNGNWLGNGWMGAIIFNGGSPVPQLSGNFTKWTDNTDGNIFRDNSANGAAGFLNCEFYGGAFSGGISTYDMSSLYFTNCLLFRQIISLWGSPNFALENCTFYSGAMNMNRSSPVVWLIENSSFDGTAFNGSDSYSANTNYTTIHFNAYNTNNLSWQTYPIQGPYNGTNETGTNDVMVDSYYWQPGTFGGFYLPYGSPLIQAGSTTADKVGLYHFTTQVDGTPETNAIVDIGYHYVATDYYGNPLDSNGDGIPDYLEDANGNGLVDSGEIAWNLTNDLGLTVTITKPQNGSILP